MGISQSITNELKIPITGGSSLRYKIAKILAQFGANAHVYMPGIGQISGLTAANYLLADGSTGLTPVDGLVGLDLDAAGGVGSELVTNGDFSAGSAGWTAGGTGGSISVASGQLTITNGSANEANVTQAGVTVVAGSTYIITLDVISASNFGIAQIGGVISGTLGVGVGKQVIIKANDTTGFYLRVNDAIAGHTLVVDNISVKQVTGIHATAAGAARPRLERGLRNLLTWSQDFTNAFWGKAGSPTITAGQTDMAGGTDSTRFDMTVAANTLLGTTGGGAMATVPVGATTAFAVDMRTLSGTQYVALQVKAGDSLTVIGILHALLTTTWQRFQVVNSANVGSPGIICNIRPSDGSAVISAQLPPVVIGMPQLSRGTTAFPYSPTTTAAASNPNAGNFSWAKEAVSQFLTLGSVPFQQTDDHCVITVARRDSSSTTQDILGLGGATGVPMVSVLEMDSASNVIHAYWRDDASTLTDIQSTIAVGETAVFATRKIGNKRDFWKNGSQAATNTTALGATTLTLALVGARPSVTNQAMVGALGSSTFILGTVSDADLLLLCRWCASTFPNAPTF